MFTPISRPIATIEATAPADDRNDNGDGLQEQQMKGAVRSRYGSPQVLRIEHLEIPAPKNDEVLVRVHATTVNRSDCHVLSGTPLAMRLFTGLFKPRLAGTGTDFAGEIDAIGRDVKTFKVGDRVMGFGGVFGIGSHAQYLVFPEGQGIVSMPQSLNYEETAACLEGAFYAAAALDPLKPRAGQKALVNGATGAIGSSYVQILKFYRVSVTAVCGGEHRDLVRSLGADRVIDYRTEDFTNDSDRYDFVCDTTGKSTFAKCKRLLKDEGVYLPSEGFQNLFLALMTSITGGKKVQFTSPQNIKAGLEFIKDLIDRGHYRPVIDRTYPLDRIAEAFAYVATGQKIGNVIITMTG